MLALEEFPPLAGGTLVALLGLIALLWLFLRVQILRRQFARGASDGDSLRAPAWLRRFAKWSGAHGLLAVTALVFGALLLFSLS